MGKDRRRRSGDGEAGRRLTDGLLWMSEQGLRGTGDLGGSRWSGGSEKTTATGRLGSGGDRPGGRPARSLRPEEQGGGKMRLVRASAPWREAGAIDDVAADRMRDAWR